MTAGLAFRATGCLIAGALAAGGCHGAESFSFDLDAGNIFVSRGTGGTVGGTGGNIIGTPGTGGGGVSGGGTGSGGVTGSGGQLDAGPASDVAPLPDALPDLALEARLPEGPFTPINCIPLAPYRPDDQAYGPDTTIFSLRDLRVYRCMPFPQSGWCTLGAYEPGLEIGYWRDCWIPVGYCQ